MDGMGWMQWEKIHASESYQKVIDRRVWEEVDGKGKVGEKGRKSDGEVISILGSMQRLKNVSFRVQQLWLEQRGQEQQNQQNRLQFLESATKGKRKQA